MYQVLLFVHIICAVIWVGGGLYAQLVRPCWCSVGGPGELPVVGRRPGDPGDAGLPAGLDPAVYRRCRDGRPAVELRADLGRDRDGPVAAFGAERALYLGPRVKKMRPSCLRRKGRRRRRPGPFMDQVFLVSRLELVSFAIIIALMVFKPGAGTA